jgi:hypothetical protein
VPFLERLKHPKEQTAAGQSVINRFSVGNLIRVDWTFVTSRKSFTGKTLGLIPS